METNEQREARLLHDPSSGDSRDVNFLLNQLEEVRDQLESARREIDFLKEGREEIYREHGVW